MKVVCHCVMVLTLLIVCNPFVFAQGAEEMYGCEVNPTGNPIGGGEGYVTLMVKSNGDP